MKKILTVSVFSTLLIFGQPQAQELIVLSNETMDEISAGTISNYVGKYHGNLTGHDTGNFNFRVKRNGRIVGKVKFNQGGKARIVGAIGNEGVFGGSLISQPNSWGIGGFYGTISGSNVNGFWTRPNDFSGTFTGTKR